MTTDTAGLLRAALDALQPLADAVFNDNGDMTLSGPYLTYDQTVAGYFAYHKIDRALATTHPARSDGPSVPAVEGEAQNGINDTFPGDPYPVVAVLQRIRQRSVQAVGAGLSRRDMAATEVAYSELRDEIDRLIIRLGGRP